MKNNIYDFFNNIDINFDDYDREDFNDVEKIKIKRNFKKSLNNENKKYIKAVGLIGMSILCTFFNRDREWKKCNCKNKNRH